MLVELTSSDERHYKVKSQVILKHIVHSTEERVLSLQQNVSLKLCTLNLICLNQHVLSNRLDRIQFTRSLENSEEDFPKCAFPNHRLDLKVI
jgi:hypothetical protein